MVRDAEAHAADDQGRRETIDARNRVDALIYSVEKTLTENRSTLEAAAIARVETALDAARAAVKGDDKDAIVHAGDELQKASHAVAEALYKAQTPGSQAAPADGQATDADVVDAEFAETK
jgi:molecular chaperone DnaK